MTDITIELLTAENFAPDSLDGYVRTQEVTEVYRLRGGEYCLVPARFTDDWTPQRKREKAAEILGDGYITYGAFVGGRVVGFAMLDRKLNCGRMILDSFQVSREYRGQGIGKRLFARALDEGGKQGAKQLYISACSSKETIGFYKSVGCRLADDIIRELADDEPYDLQLVCDINR